MSWAYLCIISYFRTGKRTFVGLLKDAYNSAVRYYYNNFNDGYRQVCNVSVFLVEERVSFCILIDIRNNVYTLIFAVVNMLPLKNGLPSKKCC